MFEKVRCPSGHLLMITKNPYTKEIDGYCETCQMVWPLITPEKEAKPS